jgi:hypothetical protein
MAENFSFENAKFLYSFRKIFKYFKLEEIWNLFFCYIYFFFKLYV